MGLGDIIEKAARGGTAVATLGLSETDLGKDILTMGGYSNAQAQAEAQKMNIAEAKKNRDFQERMSNTAYQRGMKDMEAAGLNPMLAYSQGGASAPSGSQATVQPVDKGAIGRGISQVAQMAAGINLQRTQADLNSAGVGASESQTDLNKQMVKNKYTEEQKIGNESSKAVEETLNKRVERKILESEKKTASANARKAEVEAQIAEASKDSRKNVAPIMPYIDAIGQSIGATAKGMSIMRRGGR